MTKEGDVWNQMPAGACPPPILCMSGDRQMREDGARSPQWIRGWRLDIALLEKTKTNAKIFFLLFLDEKKQKSSDCTEFAENFLLRRKSFNSSHTPERFIVALMISFLNANSVMSAEKKTGLPRLRNLVFVTMVRRLRCLFAIIRGRPIAYLLAIVPRNDNNHPHPYPPP